MNELKQREPYETKLMFKQRQISHLVSENKTLKEALRLATNRTVLRHECCQLRVAVCIGGADQTECIKCWIDHFIHQATPEGG